MNRVLPAPPAKMAAAQPCERIYTLETGPEGRGRQADPRPLPEGVEKKYPLFSLAESNGRIVVTRDFFSPFVDDADHFTNIMNAVSKKVEEYLLEYTKSKTLGYDSLCFLGLNGDTLVDNDTESIVDIYCVVHTFTEHRRQDESYVVKVGADGSFAHFKFGSLLDCNFKANLWCLCAGVIYVMHERSSKITVSEYSTRNLEKIREFDVIWSRYVPLPRGCYVCDSKRRVWSVHADAIPTPQNKIFEIKHNLQIDFSSPRVWPDIYQTIDMKYICVDDEEITVRDVDGSEIKVFDIGDYLNLKLISHIKLLTPEGEDAKIVETICLKEYKLGDRRSLVLTIE